MVRQQQALAELVNGAFKLAPAAVAWSHYEDPATLNDMLRSAADLAWPEKTGLHPLVLSNPHVIDVEVSLERAGDADAGTTGDQDRIDAVTLEERDSTVWVVFHEAKHFSNPASRRGIPARIDRKTVPQKPQLKFFCKTSQFLEPSFES